MAGSTSTGKTFDYFVGNTLSIALERLCEEIIAAPCSSATNCCPDFIAGTPSSSRARLRPNCRPCAPSHQRPSRRLVGDPAARNFPEILIGYPGMTAIIHHRLAHILHG